MHQEGRAEPPFYKSRPCPTTSRHLGAWRICENNPRKHSHSEWIPKASPRWIRKAQKKPNDLPGKSNLMKPLGSSTNLWEGRIKKPQFWYFNLISNLQTWILAPLPWPYFRSSLKIEFLMPKEDLLQKLLKSEIQTQDAFSEIFWESLPSNIIKVFTFSFPIVSFKNNLTSG